MSDQAPAIPCDDVSLRGSLQSRIKNLFSARHIGKSLVSASIMAFMVYCAGAALSYVSQLVVARSIGAHSFGIFAYVTAWVTLLGYLAALGFNISLMRFIPSYRTAQQWPLIRGIMQFSQRAALGAGGSVAVIVASIVMVFGERTDAELSAAFLIGAVTIPVMSLHLINAAAVRSFGGIVRAVAPERLVRDGVLMIVVGGAVALQIAPPDARLAAVGACVGALATLACLKAFLIQLHAPEMMQRAPAFARRDWLAPSLPLMFTVVADNLMSRSGTLMLGLTGYTIQAGAFAVALSISMLTALPRMAIATRFAPTVAELYAQQDHRGLQDLAARASLLSFVGTASVAIPLLVFAEPLMNLFGHEFVAGVPLVTILIGGQILSALGGPQQHLITMTGHERQGAMIQVSCAVLNLAAALVAIKLYGPVGAAWSMAALLVAWHAAMAIFIYRRLHLLPGMLALVKRVFTRVKTP